MNAYTVSPKILKVVLVGASGRVGSLLVPELVRRQIHILIAGRSANALRQKYPDVQTCEIGLIHQTARGFDAVFNLAAMNNDKPGEYADFYDANVRFLDTIATAAKHASVPHLINFSSTHALDLTNLSHYAVTKREAAAQLARHNSNHIATKTLFLPNVCGPDYFTGRLSALNRLPSWIRRPLCTCIGRLRSTVSVDAIADYITSLRWTENETAQHITATFEQHATVYLLTKRALDILICSAVLLLFCWIFPLIWIAIKLDSPGPGFFCQERVGLGGRPFRLYKFRTMHTGTAHCGTHEVSPLAVTRVGAVLRKLKIDELPQVFNVIRNEMSLVGPRPSLTCQRQLIDDRLKLGVLNAKPGITGLAQIHGIDMSVPRLLAAVDANYLSQRSLATDFRIMFATAVGRGRGDRLKPAA